ncbi:hypothetical protein EXD82_01535 [Peptacetobacter hominis]|uniref:Uncharacterized protein n=1 Tax=Peptacetobacter hominis TaxID=2743610 RepID=A0A544QXL3_9FIRM|nr:hypothetical protein [Peptacetobacter hominis]TQQ85456.1 hypothetical protein EXD82_01535 [Peptacetobacter hominis]
MLDKRIKLTENFLKVLLLIIVVVMVFVGTSDDINNNISMQQIIEYSTEVMSMFAFICLGFRRLYKSIDDTSETIQKVDHYCKISSIGAILITCVLISFTSISFSIKTAILVIYTVAVLIWGNILRKSLKTK